MELADATSAAAREALGMRFWTRGSSHIEQRLASVEFTVNSPAAKQFVHVHPPPLPDGGITEGGSRSA